MLLVLPGVALHSEMLLTPVSVWAYIYPMGFKMAIHVVDQGPYVSNEYIFKKKLSKL